jgi:DNA-binding transcriptional LysR family regulator
LVRLVATSLPALRAKHPCIDIRTIGGALRRSLARGEAAVALWFEMPPDHTEFAVKLGEVPYAIYKPRGADAETLGWCAFWDDEAPRRAPTRFTEKARGAAERLVLTATDSTVVLAGIRGGVGKGLLPMCLAEGDPLIERVRPGPPELVRAMHLHAHPDTIQMARVQATIAWIRESFCRAFTPAAEQDHIRLAA